ncbi:DNA polymerase III subunit delta' [Anaeromicropila populeti]|nr:DNA polymerase III subunit delta' [Anaeromicropila populeti]
MKVFDNIIGHDKIIENMMKSVELGKISHAYILEGEPGSGKSMLAGLFAKALQCENENQEDKPCGRCKSCLQAVSNNHPDIIKVIHEKASIGVDDIRIQVNSDIGVKPYSSPYKIYIIDDADKMTEQAQNALLKTIEEPPGYGVLLLLASNASKLLPTILSRCVILKLKPVSVSDIKKYLMEKHQVPDYMAEISAKFSQGNVGKAIRYASSEEFIEGKNEVLHLLKYVDEMKTYELLEGIKRLTERKLEIYDYIDLMILWYRDVLLFKVTNNPNLLLYREEFAFIKKDAQKSSYEGIEEVIKAMEKAKERLRSNVNFEIAIELMLLVIKENGNG